jgi:uncharacterized protein (TIGR04255 family)
MRLFFDSCKLCDSTTPGRELPSGWAEEGSNRGESWHASGGGRMRGANRLALRRTSVNTPLPSFKSPPVVETVLGVEFEPLAALTVPYFGLYWSRIRDRYPRTEVQPALGRVTEQFGPGRTESRPTVEFVETPVVRCWYFHKSDDRLLQLQQDRFIHNWRKAGRDSEYPRYETLKPCFEEEWRGFLAFLQESKIDPPRPAQCEVTYVNHIDTGSGWRGLGDAAEVTTLAGAGMRAPFLGEPESLAIATNYLLPEGLGRLRVSVQHALRRDDGRELLQMTLTARGAPKSPDWSDVSAWFDLGHEWVVRGFTDLTTRGMHALWERAQ